MISDSDIDRAFIYRVFFRRGGKSLSQSLLDAKSSGATLEWLTDPESRVMWIAADEMFNEPNFEKVNSYKLVQRANAIASRMKGREYEGVSIDHNFFNNYEKSVNGADDIGGFCTMLRDRSISRKTMEACQEANDMLVAGEDATSVVSRLSSAIQSILSGEKKSGLESVESLVDNVIEQYDNAYHHVQELGEVNYTPGIPMPWKKLTFAMNGFPSVLTILAARPGVGKTSMAIEMMRYWLDMGYKVVFDSLDMGGSEFMKRQMSEISQISSRKLQFGKTIKQYWEGEDGDRAKVLAAGEKMKQLEREGKFTLYTEYDVDRLKANVKILKDQNKIDVLVVDYIQLMKCKGGDKMPTHQRVSYISNTLHAITVEYGVPVLALSQINRDSSKDGVAPQLHDIKDSGSIEQDATNVIILHPNWTLKNKWKDNPPEQFMRNGENTDSIKSLMPMWVILAKARDGDSGTEIPFVVVQNKYSWYQGDYQATGDDMFLRVWDNWKHDPIEKVWKSNGILISTEAQETAELLNRKHELPRPQYKDPEPTYEQQDMDADLGGGEYEGSPF